MRFWKWLMPSMVLLVLALRLSACPSGYESPESLVRHARLIIQVEVLSVEEAPLPAEVKVRPGINNYGRSCGKARVKVVEIIKGECAEREFTLIGGPYHTCAPYLMYHAFTVGEKPVLILDAPLPPKVDTVVIAWRNRLIQEKVEHVKNLMEQASINWKMAVERHRRASPDDMAKAEHLHAASVENPAFKAPSSTPYAVQACLAVLSNDPDHLPPAEEPDPSGSFLADFYQSLGAYVSAQASRDVHSAGSQTSASRPSVLRRAQPAEAAAFNTKLLKTILVDELAVPPALAASALENPKLQKMWQNPQDSGIWLTLDRPAKEDMTAEVLAFYHLILLAAPEPDHFVWGSFAMDMPEKGDGFLPPDLFVGFLGRSPQRPWWGQFNEFMILASLPHPQIAPMVRAFAQKGFYDNVPRVLVRYFVRLKSEPDVSNAVGLLEKGVEQFLQSMAKPESDPSNVRYYLTYYQDEVADALAQVGTTEEFKGARERLNELSKRLKAVQVPETSTGPSR